MSKNTQSDIIKKAKRGLKKKSLVKDIKSFLQKKNKKGSNVVVNHTKIYQELKDKSWLIIEKQNVMK